MKIVKIAIHNLTVAVIQSDCCENAPKEKDGAGPLVNGFKRAPVGAKKYDTRCVGYIWP